MAIPEEELQNLLAAVWGYKIDETIFSRWFQGFEFSTDEPLALVQYQGGPCAILTPIQAYIVNHLFESAKEREVQVTTRDPQVQNVDALHEAMSEVLCQCQSAGIFLVEQCRDKDQEGGIDAAVAESISTCPCLEPAAKMRKPDNAVITTKQGRISNTLQTTSDIELFHKSLLKSRVESREDLRAYLDEHVSSYSSPGGLLLFLYSVVLTNGISNVMEAMQLSFDTLIDASHGLGNQSLINLLITGRAVPNLWNMDRTVDGLCLRGINRQQTVGYLSILEDLKYCEVGSFLKSPKSPVWILASETHLTLLFATNLALTHPETERERATRIFRSFDKQGMAVFPSGCSCYLESLVFPYRARGNTGTNAGLYNLWHIFVDRLRQEHDNGFIGHKELGQVLEELDLCCDSQYMQIILQQLDEESLGIVLEKSFLDEFFPEQPTHNSIQESIVYHYNGLRKRPDWQVQFSTGKLRLTAAEDPVSEPSALLRCLRTKWPDADVVWDSPDAVTLN